MARPSKAKKEIEATHFEIVLRCNSIAKKHRMAMDKHVEEHGLQQGQHKLILALSRMGESAYQKDLAEVLHLTPAAVAVNLKKLEKLGIVEKKMSETDNRYNEVQLTEEGRTFIKESEEIFHQINEQSFKGMTEEELNTLEELLAKVEVNLTEAV